ncbi:hypothetical protein FD754_023442 [Muntiacus muntjak]|uniref:NAD(P)(+)--arginine ADP-ribosyltransferase n=1 Tax=Muntiacus muntjak TaxID=9888 RepID=A0A5N3UTH6_MUNMU|nr:hypothetical protein FD754_023442 [Muntiacus muntjak]
MQSPAVMSVLLVSMGLMEALQVRSSFAVPMPQLLASELCRMLPLGMAESEGTALEPNLLSREMPLDRAWDSFDDQYVGCAAAMVAAFPDLNRTEFQENKVYADGWAKASSRVALLAYMANGSLYKEFNKAMRKAGSSRAHYLQRFSFKTLHFLLTEALQLLHSNQHSTKCHQVFRGVQDLRFRPPGTRATVRLGTASQGQAGNRPFPGKKSQLLLTLGSCLLPQGSESRGQEGAPASTLLSPFSTTQYHSGFGHMSWPAPHVVLTAQSSTGRRVWAEEQKSAPPDPTQISPPFHPTLQCLSCVNRRLVVVRPVPAVWSLLLLLWFLVGEVFPESPGLL